jgi:hypothetical protein
MKNDKMLQDAYKAEESIKNGASYEEALIGQSFIDTHKTSVWQCVFEKNLDIVLYIEKKHQLALAVSGVKNWHKGETYKKMMARLIVSHLTKGWLEAKPEWVKEIWPIWLDVFKNKDKFVSFVGYEVNKNLNIQKEITKHHFKPEDVEKHCLKWGEPLLILKKLIEDKN